MKAHVEQGAAQFLVEMAQVPDLLQQSTSRLKRRVKGLYQVVSDLELPVASVLSLRLQCTSKVAGAAGQPLHQPASEEAYGEQIQQQRALQSYTQVGLSLVKFKLYSSGHNTLSQSCMINLGQAWSRYASKCLRMVQAGMGLIASTLERAQVEAMMLLNQTADFPGQQVSQLLDLINCC